MFAYMYFKILKDTVRDEWISEVHGFIGNLKIIRNVQKYIKYIKYIKY